MTSPISYVTHPKVEISRAKLDVCTSKSFGGGKAYVPPYIRKYVHTDTTALYVLDWSKMLKILVAGFYKIAIFRKIKFFDTAGNKFPRAITC